MLLKDSKLYVILDKDLIENEAPRAYGSASLTILSLSKESRGISGARICRSKNSTRPSTPLVSCESKKRGSPVEADKDILKIAEDVLRGGADIVQLRYKSSDDRLFLQTAKAIRSLTKRYKRLFVINDRVDIALIVNADGVHLGQDDLPIEESRKLLDEKIVGISTHSLEEIESAIESGADYIGIGPIFKSPTKKRVKPIGLNLLCYAKKAIDIPFFAIGGITPYNIRDVRRAGADRIAIASSAICAPDVYKAVKEIKRILTHE